MIHKIEIEIKDEDWKAMSAISAIVGIPVSALIQDLFVDSKNIHRFVINLLNNEKICTEIIRNERNIEPHSVLVKYLQEFKS